MEIKPITDGAVGGYVNKFDSKVQYDNPSLFMPKSEKSVINENTDLIFNYLYSD